MAPNHSLPYLEMMARELAEIAKADDLKTLEYIFRMAAEEAAWLLTAGETRPYTSDATERTPR